MSLTPSNMLPLGTIAPTFSLYDTVSGESISLESYAQNKPVMIAFICNHCPYVKHLIGTLANVCNTYQEKGIACIAISANDIDKYPEDSPEKMKQLAQSNAFAFPYCYDKNQSVAKAYDAACTPDFYLFNSNHKLVYRGQFDSSRPNGKTPPSGADLIAAMDNLLSGNAIAEKQIPSVGCNIKWANIGQSS